MRTLDHTITITCDSCGTKIITYANATGVPNSENGLQTYLYEVKDNLSGDDVFHFCSESCFMRKMSEYFKSDYTFDLCVAKTNYKFHHMEHRSKASD